MIISPYFFTMVVVALSLVFPDNSVCGFTSQVHLYAAALGINPLPCNSHRGHLVRPKRLGGALKGSITKSWWSRSPGRAKFDGVEESGFQAESNGAKARRLTLEAEALQLQAKRLHLEAEKERLLIAQDEVLRNKKKVIEQDETISQIIEAWKMGQLKDELMISFEKSVDAELFLRMSDLAETGKVAREDLVGVSRAIMSAVDAMDSEVATKLRDDIKLSMCQATKIWDVQNGEEFSDGVTAESSWLLQAPNASYSNTTDEFKIVDNLEPPFESLPCSGSVQPVSNNLTIGTTQRRNASRVDLLPKVLNEPLWIPPSLLQLAISAPKVSNADIESLKDKIFGIDTFYVTEVEQSPHAVVFCGNLRGRTSSDAFALVQERLARTTGLNDRVQLFLSYGGTPAASGMDWILSDKSNDEYQPRPVFIAISKEAGYHTSPTVMEYLCCAGFALATVFTSCIYDTRIFAGNDSLPIAGGILALVLVHEVAHWVAAQATGNKLAPPIFLPSLQIGSFGSITSLHSFPKNMNELFEIFSAGPMIGTIASVATLLVGLQLTGSSTPEAQLHFPSVSAKLYHSSLLVGMLSSVALPKVMVQPFSSLVPSHPMVIVGIIGCLINALNLMPFGRLDGGRMASAVLNRNIVSQLGTVALLMQAGSALYNHSTLQLVWVLFVPLFQCAPDLPVRDEISSVDGGKDLLLWCMLSFSLLTLLPFPNI